MISVLKTRFPKPQERSKGTKFGVPKQLGKNACSASKLAREVRSPPSRQNAFGALSVGGIKRRAHLRRHTGYCKLVNKLGYIQSG